MKKNNWNIFKRTQAYLKPYILPYLFFVVISGAGQFLTFSSVGVFLKEILLVVNGSEQSFTFQDGLLYLLATFLFTCMMGAGIYNIKKIEQKVKVQMRDEMLDSYMHADEKIVENITTKDVMNRMSMDLTKMVDLVGWIMAGSIYMPVISGFCSVVYLYFIDYRIAILCLLLAIIQYFLLRLFSKRRAKEVSDITVGTDDVIQFVNEEVDGIHEIHSFHLNDSFRNIFE
jgi:ABC-type multidrug transport system fused ATPase/permease subunit